MLASTEGMDLLNAAALGARRPEPERGGHLLRRRRGIRKVPRHLARATVGERMVNVAIALPRHPAIDALEEFQDRLLYSGGAIVVITIIATTLLVGIGLRPIGRTARALGAVTDRNVADAHIEAGGAPPSWSPSSTSSPRCWGAAPSLWSSRSASSPTPRTSCARRSRWPAARSTRRA